MSDTPAAPPGNEPSGKKDTKDTFIRFRITSAAFNRVAARARAAGYSLGAYCRKKVDEDDGGERARRRPIPEKENIMELLGQLGSIRALHNQMAHQANIRGFDPAAFEQAQKAAQDYRDWLFEQMGRKAPPSRVRKGARGRFQNPGAQPPRAPGAGEAPPA
jgi:hypothetical protein